MQKNKKYWLLNISCVTVVTVLFLAENSGGLHGSNSSKFLPQSLYGQLTTTSVFCTEMVGYWKFDTGLGLSAVDTSGQGNTGEFVSMTETSWTEETAEQISFWNPSAVTFPGSGYIKVQTGSNVNINGSLTISAWVNFANLATTADGNMLLAYAGESAETSTENPYDNYRYALSINGTNKKIRMMWENSSNATDIILESSVSAALLPSEWNHIAVTRNSTDKEVRFYVNGIQLGATQNYTLPPSGSSGSAVLYIGAGPHNTSATFFTGDLDDVRLYSKALADAQINTLFESTGILLGCTCGNNEIEPPEECDDGNASDTDACTTSCTIAKCGDGYLQPGEECEPRGTEACSNSCEIIAGAEFSASSVALVIPPNCGNRVVNENEGEQCDDGHLNGKGNCSKYCTILSCGDGIVSPEIDEECEPAPTGSINGLPTFTEAACGNVCSIPEYNNADKLISGCTRLFLPPCEAKPIASEASISSSTSIRESTSSEELKNAAPQQNCGNLVVDENEQCDDGGICEGGDANGTIVSNAAEASFCTSGGGQTIAKAGDGCSETCTTEYCGDGVLQPAGTDGTANTFDDEQCDNGSVCSNDLDSACLSDDECETVENCAENSTGALTCGGANDGNTCTTNADCTRYGRCIYNFVADTNCTNACTLLQPVSSSASSESSENVTFEFTSPNSSVPLSTAVCGNFIIETGEQCDDGIVNSDTLPDACRTDCTKSACGDSVVDAIEECDNGPENSDTRSDSCRTNCTLPVCGDNIRDSGEDCDGGPTCQNDCTFPTLSVCGNGILEGSEKCDDGNIWPGDGCSSICAIEPKILPIVSVSSISSVPISSVSISSVPMQSSSATYVAGVQSVKSSISSMQNIPVAVAVTSSSMQSRFTLQPIQQSQLPSVQPLLGSLLPTQIPAHSPVGDTGPATILVVAGGATSGFLWKRKKKRKV